MEQFVTIFTNMGGLMAERVTDLRDIERRVVAHLVGEPAPGVPDARASRRSSWPRTSRPSDTSGLDPELVTALVTERGGATSHTAIIARQLGIPCVVGAAGIMALAGGTFVVVDGETGTIEQGADPDEARARVEESRRLREELAAWTGPAATVRRPAAQAARQRRRRASATSAAVEPVQGVGLFRTELCFLDQKEEPTRRGAGRHLRRRPRRPTPTAATSSSAPSTPAPTSRSRSRPTRARRTPRSACAACA